MALNFYSDQRVKLIFGIIFSAWWFVWAILQAVVLQDFGITPGKAVADGLISNILLAGFCLLLINNMKYYLPKREKYIYVLIVSFVLSTVWLGLIRLILKAMYKEDALYMQVLARSSSIRYAIAFLMISCVTMLGLLWFSQKEQKEDMQHKIDLENLARDAELNKLRQQLQPHFLFNSLNSISALTGQQPEKARHMIQQLSDFLRGSLKNEVQQWVSLEDELKYLQLYLDIEKVRFGYRLQTSIETDEAVMQMKLPSMLLQPMVENAIKFGLYDTIGEVTILIAAKSSNGMLEVTVENPYDESTSVQMKGTGFGLASVKRRLFLLFGRHDLLQLKKETGKFTATITLPQTV